MTHSSHLHQKKKKCFQTVIPTLRDMTGGRILTLERCGDLIRPESERERTFRGLLPREHLLGCEVLGLEHVLLGLAVMNHHVLWGQGCHSGGKQSEDKGVSNGHFKVSEEGKNTLNLERNKFHARLNFFSPPYCSWTFTTHKELAAYPGKPPTWQGLACLVKKIKDKRATTGGF